MYRHLSQVGSLKDSATIEGMETYRRRAAGRRKAAEVQALKVQRPYRSIQFDIPRSHRKDKPSGAIDYIRIIDAPEGRNRARDGDWIVKNEDGTLEVVTAVRFELDYVKVGESDPEVGAPDSDTEALE